MVTYLLIVLCLASTITDLQDLKTKQNKNRMALISLTHFQRRPKVHKDNQKTSHLACFEHH